MPEFISVTPKELTVTGVDQTLLHVGRQEKLSLLLGLLRREEWSRILIFVNTKAGVEWLAEKLKGNGFAADVPPEGELNALGWEVYPDGLYQAIRRLGSHGKPVIITENGICARDDDDPQRVRYLHSHLDAVERARRDGVRVEGYLYWTLYDNYEWAEGFEPRFGLVEMDFETLERRPRPSAREFAGLRGIFTEV